MKFKIGDRVLFNKYEGNSQWSYTVPKTPLTIKYVEKFRDIFHYNVKESAYTFVDEWLSPADTPQGNEYLDDIL